MGLTTTIHKKITSRLTSRLRGADDDNNSPRAAEQENKYSEQSSVVNLSPGLPTVYQCTIHLKLMKVLAHLREDVKRTKGLLSRVEDERAESYSSNDDNEELLKLHEKRWDVYVDRAAQRFETWWKAQMAVRSDVARKTTLEDLLTPGEFEMRIKTAIPFSWSETNILPIDVLMVLHSYMLNPRRFLEDCIRFDMLSLWKAGIPWDIVDRCLRPKPLEYHPEKDAQDNWKQLTGSSWDNLDDENHHSAMDETQYELSLKKLQKSLIDLREGQIPLQGTILSYNGTVNSSSGGDDDISSIPNENSFANTVLQTELGAEILDLISAEVVPTITIQSLKDLIHEWIKDSANQKSIGCTNTIVSSENGPLINKKANTSINLFLSAHEHQSIFSLDLAAAVKRQTIFIDAMAKLAWIYTPALNLTLTKLIQKYTIFIKLIGRYPEKIAVPTHAVDLSWHTHQLSPESYYTYTVAVTGAERRQNQNQNQSEKQGEFIDHDDKLSDTILTGAFEWTGQAYLEEIKAGGQVEGSGPTGQTGTNNTYSECLCWHCMTSESIQKRLTDNNNNNNENSILEPMILERIAAKQHEKLEDDYARELQRAQSKRLDHFNDNANNKIDRDDYLKSYEWLYPNAIPILSQSKKQRSRWRKGS